MACSCNKNSTAPTGSTASRQAAQKVADSAKARAANTSTQRIGPAQPSMQGQTQSFALRTPNGKTASFGSLLEARAARARVGGEIVTD